jgi:hypothetical protein
VHKIVIVRSGRSHRSRLPIRIAWLDDAELLPSHDPMAIDALVTALDATSSKP